MTTKSICICSSVCHTLLDSAPWKWSNITFTCHHIYENRTKIPIIYCTRYRVQDTRYTLDLFMNRPQGLVLSVNPFTLVLFEGVPDDRSVAIFRQWHLDVRSVAVGRSVSGCVYSPSVADNLLIMGNYHANGDIG